MKPIRFAAAAGMAALFLGIHSGSAQETFQLKWQESGISQLMLGYRPLLVTWASNSPAAEVGPAGLKAPRHGSFTFGQGPKAPRFNLVVDYEDSNPARLIVDENANGSLNDDPAHGWTTSSYKNPTTGKTSVTYYSEAILQVPIAGETRHAQVKFYRLKTDRPAQQGEALLYYADHGYHGEVQVNGKKYAAALIDMACSGEFQIDPKNPARSPAFWLDLDGNGRASGRNESLSAGRPFEVEGQWWTLTNLNSRGQFQIVASVKPPPTAAEIADAKLAPGNLAPAFVGPLLSGGQVRFPGDFKGKVVLLDFWATWCGPCIAELPNVIKAYEKYHPQGLEILGISLDKANLEEKVLNFTKERKMPWAQVYDGKFWEAAVARQYGITGIPHMLLVDGDTGRILANKTIRGEALTPAIEKALAARKAK